MIGDVKQLQLQEKRSAQAIEKMVNPPMVGPPELRNAKASILPGDITYINQRDAASGFRPAHEVNFRIAELEQKNQQIRQRISRVAYEDLFLMLASSDRREFTATEIAERKEEKLLALGPVLEQLNQDLLDPLIENTFNIMLQQGLLPEPPEELQGMALKIEYTSIMAQAQKAIGISGLDRFIQFTGNLAQVQPEVLDKVDADEAIDLYGDMTGMPPTLIRDDDKVAAIRQQRAQAQAKQAAAENAQMTAQSAKTLSETNMNNPDSALNSVVEAAKAGQLTQQ
jgi:hypothetical protein